MADRVEAAVRKVLAQGFRIGDLHRAGTKKVGTSEMGDAVVAALCDFIYASYDSSVDRSGEEFGFI